MAGVGTACQLLATCRRTHAWSWSAWSHAIHAVHAVHSRTGCCPTHTNCSLCDSTVPALCLRVPALRAPAPGPVYTAEEYVLRADSMV